MRRISAHLVLTPDGLERGKVVTLTDDGVVTDISSPLHLDREAGVEFFSGVLVPGFWNAHCHLELSYLRGAIAPGGGFAAFARGMRAARGTPPAGGTQPTAGGGVGPTATEGGQELACDAARVWDAKMWESGVTHVSDVCNSATTFAVKSQSPIRYHNFCESFGLGADPGRVRALCGEARARGLSANVTPHSTYSLNRAAFLAAASRQLDPICTSDPTTPAGVAPPPLSIHFLESEQEIELFQHKGPLWSWYMSQGLAPDFLDYGSPAERLVAQVAPEREIMLIHNCCATQRDIDIVMGHFTAPVTWVVCPGSNRYISGLTPPIDLLRKNRLKIAVGTDSLASNESLDMVRELASMPHVPLAERLGWAAADTIAPGRVPGLVLLTGVDFQKMTVTEVTKSERIL